jgi:hypothetical protein
MPKMTLDLQFDHVGFIREDLSAAARTWEALGFQLSPVSPQMGLAADGIFEPWATANQCAVFEHGYLELLGVHRPECFNPWVTFLARFEGAHIAAFRCEIADQTFAQLRPHSKDFEPPVQRRRDAPFWHEDQWGTREMRFRNIFSDDARVQECRYILIEHQSPDVLWQPTLQAHPNGARALLSMSMVNPAADTTQRLGLLGVPQSDGRTFACTDGGHIEVSDGAQWSARFPDNGEPPANAIGSCTVAVDDLTVLRTLLRTNAVPYCCGSGFDASAGQEYERVWVPAQYANGTVIEFVPNDRTTH